MRQHATPILIDSAGRGKPLTLPAAGHGWSEAAIQALIHSHPCCLPITEIDPLFADPVPICTELGTPAGPIDNLLVTASGLPILVECKLWANPQARREVVGQILDYAKELSRWSSSDLQREASRRLKRPGNALLDLVREAGHDVDEIAFNDALTLNLRRGRLLLLIVGDGIREGVEAIAEYLQAHAGLHFTLGLVELPIYAAPDGAQLVAPRVLARTINVTRTVVFVPDGTAVTDEVEADSGGPEFVLDADHRRAGRARRRHERTAFWEEFLASLTIDDPDQARPEASAQGHITFPLPVNDKSIWVNAYRSAGEGKVGVSIKCRGGSIGARIMDRLIDDDLEYLKAALGGDLSIWSDNGQRSLYDAQRFGDLNSAAVRAAAFGWLRPRLNDFLNAIRPRVRSAAAELTGS